MPCRTSSLVRGTRWRLINEIFPVKSNHSTRPVQPKKSLRRSLAFTLIKAGVAGLLLWFLLRGADTEALRRLLAEASPSLLLAGLLLNIGTVLIAGLRWKLLVRAVGLPLRWRDLTCIAFIGQFFATFLPGPVGDDLTRMIYIARAAGEKTPLALSSVLLDRLIGLSVILLLALFVTPWHYALLVGNPQTALLAGGIVVGGAIVLLGTLLFFILPRASLHLLGVRLMHLLPAGRFRIQAGRFAAAYLDHRATLVSVMTAALGTQLILCLIFWLAGAAVGVEASPLLWFGFVPVVLAANAVPITIAGLGVREYLVTLFLNVLAGFSSEQAMAASLAAFAIMLATNLLGGLVYLFYHLTGRANPPAPRSSVPA